VQKHFAKAAPIAFQKLRANTFNTMISPTISTAMHPLFSYTFAAMKKWMVICFAVLAMGCSNNTQAPAETKSEISGTKTNHDAGKKLFYRHCASCHMVNKELTGPALKNLMDRWPDTAKLYAFIRNSDSVIQVDDYAKKLWLQYNQTLMPAHPQLSDYIDESSGQ
jgi:cytochrome c2